MTIVQDTARMAKPALKWRVLTARILLVAALSSSMLTVSAFVAPVTQLPQRRILEKNNYCRLQVSQINQDSSFFPDLKITQIEEESSKNEGGTASIPALTISLVKSIVGGGVLALPAAVASLGDSPDVILPAVGLIAAMGFINAFFFSLLGRVCSLTGATSYREAWERSMGPESSHFVAVIVVLKTALCCLVYSMILADSFQSLAVASGFFDVTRVEALASVTLFGILPLCLIRDLKSLAPFSMMGLVGIGLSMAAMLIRSMDGSYAEGGFFLNDLPLHLQPSFGESGLEPHGLIVLTCTLATAFVAHYNAPRLNYELENNTVERFNTLTMFSFAISIIAFVLVAAAGFLTFGSASSGLVLNNYSPHDPLVATSRVAVGLSILLTYPLPFLGLRDGVSDLLDIADEDRTDTKMIGLSVELLAAITIAACLAQDLSLVLSVGGGTFSTAVSSFPALMFQAAVKNNGTDSDPQNNFDSKLGLALMGLCGGLGATGAITSLEKAFH